MKINLNSAKLDKLQAALSENEKIDAELTRLAENRKRFQEFNKECAIKRAVKAKTSGANREY